MNTLLSKQVISLTERLSNKDTELLSSQQDVRAIKNTTVSQETVKHLE